MTFLQPWILWGLPLILLPVIIHFLNRMRHRPQPWAAMRFLLAATRSSVSNTRLRQFLILLFRVLAVLMLVLFVARPLAGGWLGWALSPAPDAILILLDRSASMENKIGSITKREQALKRLAESAAQFEEKSHLILIDSASRTPQELAKASSLSQLSLTKATDTAADIPAMLHSAVNWLIENRAGTAEIWIASDGQRSNWQPEDARWKNTVAQLAAMSQKVRVRVLSLNEIPEANISVSLKELVRQYQGEKSQLNCVVDIQRNGSSSAPIPIAMNLDGSRSQREIALEGQSLRWRHKTDLGNRKIGGWGSFELPADSNVSDNKCFFVYGPDTLVRACVVSSDRDAVRLLQFAAADRKNSPADCFQTGDFSSVNLSEYSLVIWQDALPTGETAERLAAFARRGGVICYMPPGRAHGQAFQGLSWGAVQDAEGDQVFRILRWDEEQGPLAKSDERISLPLPELTVIRRQLVAGPHNALAAFEDGTPFLIRQALGKGQIYCCTSLPHDEWSTLAEGPVLVPMVQRLLQAGAAHMQGTASMVACGELSATEATKSWSCIDSTEPKDIRYQAGVYRSGDQVIAVNRPASEDEPEVLESEETRKLFGTLAFQSLEERSETGKLQGEIWRLFLVSMLLFLIAEGILILPGGKTSSASKQFARGAGSKREVPA